MPLKKELIDRIRAKMESAGIKTVKELSDKSGIRRATLSAILNESVETVKLNTLSEIAGFFGCSVSDLLKGIY